MVKRIIYPPVWLVLGLVTVFALNTYLPGPRFTAAGFQFVGALVIVVGLLLLVLAGGLFKQADIGLTPFTSVSTLVTNGVYRYTRNPMYFGMLLVLLGCAVTVGSFFALGVQVAFALVIQWRFILPEEAMLRELFPESYPAYCRRVRRWI